MGLQAGEQPGLMPTCKTRPGGGTERPRPFGAKKLSHRGRLQWHSATHGSATHCEVKFTGPVQGIPQIYQQNPSQELHVG